MWNIKASEYANKTANPLRLLIETEKLVCKSDKSKIVLRAGDPSVFGNFPPHPCVNEAIANSLSKNKFKYEDSVGNLEARQAAAEYCKHMGNVTADDVILTSGCSMAIETCLLALANPGDNILIPRPAWHYISNMAGSKIELVHYNLDPLNDWQIDLKHLESVINKQTRAIVVNSPGNPCGNVFSKQHMLDIIQVAERYQLPIISDEVYGFLTFPGVQHYSFAELSKNVPVLVCTGIGKRFLMPGARLGWIVISDGEKRLGNIRRSFMNILGRGVEPSSIIQYALPDILANTPSSFFEDTKKRVYNNAVLLHNGLKDIPGLKPIMPKGSMYTLLKIDLAKFPKIKSSMEFMELLVIEQNVFVFPSECFHYPGFLRIVLTMPEEIIPDLCQRFTEICKKYFSEEQ